MRFGKGGLTIPPAPVSGVGPSTRGFLFADLRDHTAFAESRSDRAAADLLLAMLEVLP